MLIVSWNVASWPATVRCIQGSCCAPRARASILTLVTTAGAFGGVECFMRRLGCDVLCLQETKASRALLQVSGCCSKCCLFAWCDASV